MLGVMHLKKEKDSGRAERGVYLTLGTSGVPTTRQGNPQAGGPRSQSSCLPRQTAGDILLLFSLSAYFPFLSFPLDSAVSLQGAPTPSCCTHVAQRAPIHCLHPPLFSTSKRAPASAGLATKFSSITAPGHCWPLCNSPCSATSSVIQSTHFWVRR